MWKPTILDQRGNDYGFVMDEAETRRAVWAIDYPKPGLNVSCGNWGPLTHRDLEAATEFLVKELAKLPA